MNQSINERKHRWHALGHRNRKTQKHRKNKSKIRQIGALLNASAQQRKQSPELRDSLWDRTKPILYSPRTNI
jgi:hypothetical protein